MYSEIFFSGKSSYIYKSRKNYSPKHFIAAISMTRVETAKHILEYQSNIITLHIVLASK